MIPIGAISADSHVVEPPNCYIDNIEPRFRDDAPRVIEQEDGSDAFFIKGMKRPVGLGLMDGAGFTPLAVGSKDVRHRDPSEAGSRVPDL